MAREVNMKSRTMRKLAVLATGAAMAISLPVASSVADQGGVPHNSKPCPTKSKGHGPKKSAPNDKGKKCGFNKS
jgi:hypothetical protein